MIEIVRAIAQSWNRSEINYAVANGLENYPRRLGRDIDVVVDPRHLQAASDTVGSILKGNGWHVVVRRWTEMVQHIGISQQTGETLIIDLFAGLRWGPTWLVERPAASLSADVFPVDPWVSFVKRVLLHVLVAPVPKFSRHSGRLALTEEEGAAVSKRLPQLIGSDLASRLTSAMQDRDITELEALRPKLRKALVAGAFRKQPIQAVRTAGQWATTRIAIAARSPAMPIISIVGPDGVGKSSVLAEVAQQAKDRLGCTEVVVRHWRPSVLPRLGSYVGRPSHDASTPPRRTAGRFGLLRTGYYALDFLFGYYLRDRRISAGLGLVVYDRGALDMYVDPLRYGLKSGRLMRFFTRFLPRPDLIVLLYDTPERIRARKAELEEAEIKRQLDLWMRLVAKGEVDMVVEVNSSPPALAKQIVERLTSVFVCKNSVDTDSGGPAVAC